MGLTRVACSKALASAKGDWVGNGGGPLSPAAGVERIGILVCAARFPIEEFGRLKGDCRLEHGKLELDVLTKSEFNGVSESTEMDGGGPSCTCRLREEAKSTHLEASLAESAAGDFRDLSESPSLQNNGFVFCLVIVIILSSCLT